MVVVAVALNHILISDRRVNSGKPNHALKTKWRINVEPLSTCVIHLVGNQAQILEADDGRWNSGARGRCANERTPPDGV